jgi:hypothetical protein
MNMGTSLVRSILLCLVIFVVSCNLALSQTHVNNSKTNDAPVASTITHALKENRIRWTWQLPHNIRKAFYESPFCAWYIEKMVSYHHAGKTVYKFFINNGSLLDSEHYDSFLEQTVVTVVGDDLTVLAKSSESL